MLVNNRLAFTLIELLIVVAIIAILAAIAVPNFLEAQVRAKVSRTKADLRTMATGLESYAVDHNKPPVRQSPAPLFFMLPAFREKVFNPDAPTQAVGLRQITTPISYLTSLPQDVFNTPARAMMAQGSHFSDCLDYMDPAQTDIWLQKANAMIQAQTGKGRGWTLFSVGPDRYVGNSSANEGGYPPNTDTSLMNTTFKVYDPTNGTISSGNIFRFQGGLEQKDLWLRPILPSGT